MRILRDRDDIGGAAVVAMMLVPIFVIMLASVIHIGDVSLARARLQAAADRAAAAGAAHLAYSLNGIAAANWRIHRAYDDLEEDFRSDTQQDADAANQRFAAYAAMRDEQLGLIQEILAGAEPRARSIAAGLIAANAPGASAEVMIDSSFELSDSIDPELQWGDPSYDLVTGASFVDPEDVDGGGFHALKFLMKRRAPDASVVVSIQQDIRPRLLRGIAPGGTLVAAQASAKAYGGSVAEFAAKGGETIQDAEATSDDDGPDHLYRSALVPMWTAGAGGFVH